MNFELARHKMVVEQLEQRGIHDPRVLEAMEWVPRHEFVPRKLLETGVQRSGTSHRLRANNLAAIHGRLHVPGSPRCGRAIECSKSAPVPDTAPRCCHCWRERSTQSNESRCCIESAQERLSSPRLQERPLPPGRRHARSTERSTVRCDHRRRRRRNDARGLPGATGRRRPADHSNRPASTSANDPAHAPRQRLHPRRPRQLRLRATSQRHPVGQASA